VFSRQRERDKRQRERERERGRERERERERETWREVKTKGNKTERHGRRTKKRAGRRKRDDHKESLARLSVGRNQETGEERPENERLVSENRPSIRPYVRRENNKRTDAGINGAINRKHGMRYRK
jgi:hypothetical protein